MITSVLSGGLFNMRFKNNCACTSASSFKMTSPLSEIFSSITTSLTNQLHNHKITSNTPRPTFVFLQALDPKRPSPLYTTPQSTPQKPVLNVLYIDAHPENIHLLTIIGLSQYPSAYAPIEWPLAPFGLIIIPQAVLAKSLQAGGVLGSVDYFPMLLADRLDQLAAHVVCGNKHCIVLRNNKITEGLLNPPVARPIFDPAWYGLPGNE